MSKGVYFRLAYTWAHAIDDGQDALVAGSPATVQNSYSTKSERGPSVTDQRQRLTISGSEELNPFAPAAKGAGDGVQSLEDFRHHNLWQRTADERDRGGRSEPGWKYKQ